MILRFWLVVLLVLFAGPRDARAQAKMRDVIGPLRERHLANGMNLVVREDHRVPLASLALRYDAGEGAAPPNLGLVAELTTSLMLEKTQHVPAGDYRRLVARAGASSWSDTTTSDAIVLKITLPAARVALPMWLWSDQMGFFDQALDDAELKTQRSVLRERRRNRLEGSPLGRLEAFGEQELFPIDHPYCNRAGELSDVDRIDRDAVIAFHDAWIAPEHATLAVVGDVLVDDVVALADRYFGSISRRDVGPPVKRPTQVVLDGSTEVDILANVPGARVAIWWPTPAFLTTDDGRLDVIANLLSGNRTAWLYWALVDEKRVATAVHTHQYSRALGSVFQVLIEGAPGKSPADILSEFDLAFEGLRKRVVRPKEIDTAVYDYLIDKLLAQDSAATWAYQYTAYEALVGTADYYGHDIDRYSHITPELIHEVIDRWLPSDRRIVLLVTPDPGVVSGGARRGKHFVPAGTP